MGWRAPGLGLLAVILILAPTGGTQGVDPAPPVEIEDVELPGLVKPLGDPGTTELEVRVGCELHELPDTDTVARLSANRTPGWANLIIAPSTLTWKTAPGDCPSNGTPFQRNVTVSVSADQGAPAYEPTQIPLEASVEKQPPAETESRTYGPYQGNVSLTPGYFHLHNVRLDVKIQEVGPNETARFEGAIDSMANHETEYRFAPRDVPEGVQATVQPESLVLAPNETGAFAVEVRVLEPSSFSSETTSVPVAIEGHSTHPKGGETGESQISVLAKFTPGTPDPRDSLPVPGLEPGVLALLGAGLARARRARSGA